MVVVLLFHSRFSSDPGGSDNENVSSSGGERPSTQPLGVGGGIVGGAGGGGVGSVVNRSKSNSSKRGLVGDSNLQSNDSSSSGSSGTGASESLSENPQHSRQRSRSSRTSVPMGDQRILGTLLEQINLLHETNSKICRNLHDTKGEFVVD